MQSVPITTNVVSSNPAHGEVYSIQLCDKGLSVTCDRSVVFSGSYVIKFVSDLRQVGGFLQVYSM